MLRVTTETPDGQGYDLTPHVEGLRWSSVNPGGDDSCSFAYKGSWRSAQPEIASRNVLRVTCGVDELWRGEIEEADRGGDGVEATEVTAYGMGRRLEKVLMEVLFISRDLGAWGEPSAQRKIDLGSGGVLKLTGESSVVEGGAGSAGPSIEHRWSRLSSTLGSIWDTVETWFIGDLDLGEIRYDFDHIKGMGAATWQNTAFLVSDDLASSYDSGTDHNGADASSRSVIAGTSGRTCALLQSYLNATSTADIEVVAQWRNVRLIGRHSLSTTGTAPNEGFTADQIVEYALDQANGISVRRVDGQSFVIVHFVVDTPTPPSDVIEEANGFEPCDYGVFGPDDVLSRDTDGYFDFKTREPETQHWVASRAECDDLDLHSEIGTLFNQVRVIYEDAAGTERTVTRTAFVPDLGDEVSETTLDAGQATQSDAERLGDAFLLLSGGYAPARGSVTISAPICHYRRGALSPAYLRADGSNLRIPDVLPSSTLFALDDSPDRRTTFPIKRVEVDASGAMPVATVDLDQSSDDLTALQARLSLMGEYGGGSTGGGDGGGGDASMSVGVKKAKKIRMTRRRKRGGR